MGRQIPSKLRFEVLKRDNFKCVYCGATTKTTALHIDHIKPHSLGGNTEYSNLATSCSDCNIGKSDTPLNDNFYFKRHAFNSDMIKFNYTSDASSIEELIENVQFDINRFNSDIRYLSDLVITLSAHIENIEDK